LVWRIAFQGGRKFGDFTEQPIMNNIKVANLVQFARFIKLYSPAKLSSLQNTFNLTNICPFLFGDQQNFYPFVYFKALLGWVNLRKLLQHIF